MTIEQIDNKINVTNIEIGGIKTDLNRISYRAGARRLTNAEMNEIAKLEGLKAEKEAKIRRLEIQRVALEFEEQYGYSMEEALRSGSSRNSTTNNNASENNSSLNSNDNSNGRGFKAAVITALTAIAVLLTIIAFSPSKNKGGSLLPSPRPTATATLATEVLFGDVSNPKDVSKRVEYIYNTELSVFLNQLGNPFLANANQSDLEDMIRVMSGELPINSNYEGSATVDKFAGLLWDVFGNYGSTPKKLNKLYPVAFSKFVESSDTETFNFISRYDKVYNDIVKYRNENNSDKVIENIILLATMQNDDVRLSGLYSGYSPTDVDQRYQLLAIASVQARYESIVLEYLESNQLTICIPVCVDAATGRTEEHNVISVFQAIRDGISKDGKLRTTADGKVVVWSEEFYLNLCKILKDKSEAQKLVRK